MRKNAAAVLPSRSHWSSTCAKAVNASSRSPVRAASAAAELRAIVTNSRESAGVPQATAARYSTAARAGSLSLTNSPER
jgi:hypothetical protein